MTVPVVADSAGYPPLLQAYLSACYRNGRNAHGLRVGQRHPGPAPDTGLVHAQISACNPGSLLLRDDENTERNQELARRLAHRRIPAWPALNVSDDGGWPEPGFWIENITLELLDQLALDFQQNACLVVTADAMIQLRLYLPAWQPFTTNDSRLQGPA